MKKLSALLALVLGVGLFLAAAPINDMKPSQARTVPINSTTVVAFSRSNAFAAAAAGAAVADTNTFTLNASTTVNLYDGLIVKMANGAGTCAATINGGVAMIKTHTATVATVTPAFTNAPDPNCNYTIGPAFLTECRVMVIGGCVSTCYVSFVSGGAGTGAIAGTNRITLAASQYITLDAAGVNYMEALASVATDNISVGCLP